MQTSDPAAPSDSSWKLYSKPGGIYARSSNAVVGPFAASSGAGGTTWNAVSNGRLTLTTAVPITTSDVTAATTLYFTPYLGNQIGTYSGSAWSVNTFTEKSITLASLTADLPYDVYIVDSTLALELVAWTNATTRATALVLQDGVYVKTGATTRRYLGTICITGTTGQCEDSLLKRLVWNMYNRVERRLTVTEGTDSWTSTATGWQSLNSSTANRVKVVCGVNEQLVHLRAGCTMKHSAGNTISVGIGLDATNANSAEVYPAIALVNAYGPSWAEYNQLVGVGAHFLQVLEYSNGSTSTMLGDAGSATNMQAGAAGWMWG